MDTEKDHEFCLRCGRKLKNQQARERGYGLICYQKMKIIGNRLFNTQTNLQSCNKKEKPP